MKRVLIISLALVALVVLASCSGPSGSSGGSSGSGGSLADRVTSSDVPLPEGTSHESGYSLGINHFDNFRSSMSVAELQTWFDQNMPSNWDDSAVQFPGWVDSTTEGMVSKDWADTAASRTVKVSLNPKGGYTTIVFTETRS